MGSATYAPPELLFLARDVQMLFMDNVNQPIEL
jgi:hypothetical protein